MAEAAARAWAPGKGHKALASAGPCFVLQGGSVMKIGGTGLVVSRGKGQEHQPRGPFLLVGGMVEPHREQLKSRRTLKHEILNLTQVQSPDTLKKGCNADLLPLPNSPICLLFCCGGPDRSRDSRQGTMKAQVFPSVERLRDIRAAAARFAISGRVWKIVIAVSAHVALQLI